MSDSSFDDFESRFFETKMGISTGIRLHKSVESTSFSHSIDNSRDVTHNLDVVLSIVNSSYEVLEVCV